MTDNYVCTLWLALFACRGKNILNIVISVPLKWDELNN